MSEVQKSFKGKNIFLTGSTGFIGKVLLEKMLRDLQDINSIYLLLRPNKTGNFQHRCSKFFDHVVYDELRKKNPDFLSKVKFIKGDVSQNDLGISVVDRQELYDNVSIVIHNAAIVRFDMTLREAIESNVIGTQRLLEMCKLMKNLGIFVYISTAYSQCGIPVTEERAYPANFDPFTAIKIANTVDDNTMNCLLQKFLDVYPNTYSFSKSLSEDIVYRYRNEFPIIVVRPSVVVPAVKDPMPNYTEGLNGYNGFGIVVSVGILRSLLCVPMNKLFYVPVDTVANTILSSIWLQSKSKTKDIKYYNTSNAIEQAVMIHTFLSNVKQTGTVYPLEHFLWAPGGAFTKNRTVHKVQTILFQIFPAMLIDMLLHLFGKPPMLIRAQRKINTYLNLIYPYISEIFSFETKNFQKIYHHLNEIDSNIFDTNIAKLSAEEIGRRVIVGLRKFVMKQKEESIPRSRLKMKIFESVDVILKAYLCVIAIEWLIIFSNKKFLDIFCE